MGVWTRTTALRANAQSADTRTTVILDTRGIGVTCGVIPPVGVAEPVTAPYNRRGWGRPMPTGRSVTTDVRRRRTRPPTDQSGLAAMRVIVGAARGLVAASIARGGNLQVGRGLMRVVLLHVAKRVV